MSVKTKTTLIIMGTLVMGVLLGTLVSSAMVNHRQEQLQRIRTSEGFVQRMDRLIQPEVEQREQVYQILEATAVRLDELHKQHKAMMRATIDSMVLELEPVLTEAQVQRMRSRFEKHRQRGDGDRGDHRHGSLRSSEAE